MMTFFSVYLIGVICALGIAFAETDEYENFIDIIKIIIYSLFSWLVIGVTIGLIFKELREINNKECNCK